MPVPVPVPALVSAAPPAAVAPSSASPSSWPSSLPKPPLPSPGPIKAIGYPADVRTCLPDPAEHAGFTADGAELGYCMQSMGTHCEWLDRNGKTRTVSAGGRRSDQGDLVEEPAKSREIAAFLKDSAVPHLGRGDCVLHPPPLAGTWAYPDIVLNIVLIDASFKEGPTPADRKIASQPLVRVGGTVAGEAAPVHPLTYSAPHHVMQPAGLGEIPFGITELNALVLSPDASELGVITHAYCMEYCDEFQIARTPVSRFASLVYNDTGFRALSKGKLDRAVELFLRAAYVDPSRELPAYNLACAYARKGDPLAETALQLAITRGGDAVRARAVKDKDFESVRAAPWFAKLTAAAP